jgi:hypothetical protein
MNLKKQTRRNFMGTVTTGVAASALMGLPHSKGITPPETRKAGSARAEGGVGPEPIFEKPTPITMAELTKMKIEGVRVVEVSDYVFGNYKGDFTSPPHADLNPKKAIIIVWEGKTHKFVFSHEASYCPFILLPSGAGPCFQFWEANYGHELFNQYGRMERNSFVDIIESGPKRVWVRWTYFGMKVDGTGPAHRGTEDFISYGNGILWRRQTYQSFWPDKKEGHCASPLDFFAAIPGGVHESELQPKDEKHGDYLVAAFLDAYSDKQYNVYWDRKWELGSGESTLSVRRTGADWFPDIEHSRGRVAALTFKDGVGYCAFGDASGYLAERTQLWDYSQKDTTCWAGRLGGLKYSHWPIGWINSGGSEARRI